MLSNFEVVRVEEEVSLIRIYLDKAVKEEYKDNPNVESKGFCDAVTIRDSPIRDKGVDLVVRRCRWYDRQSNRYFRYLYKAAGTHRWDAIQADTDAKEEAKCLRKTYTPVILANENTHK